MICAMTRKSAALALALAAAQITPVNAGKLAQMEQMEPVQPVMRLIEHRFCDGKKGILASGIVVSGPLPLKAGSILRDELNKSKNVMDLAIESDFAYLSGDEKTARNPLNRYFATLAKAVEKRTGKRVKIELVNPRFKEDGPCVPQRKLAFI